MWKEKEAKSRKSLDCCGSVEWEEMGRKSCVRNFILLENGAQRGNSKGEFKGGVVIVNSTCALVDVSRVGDRLDVEEESCG